MKTKVGVLMGGFSLEFEISILSGNTVYEHIDKERFEPYKVYILRDRWFVLHDDEEYPVDKNDFTCDLNGQKLRFDVLFNVIHGLPGEDGKLQGYLEMMGIKHTSCDAFESALTFNKAECNAVLKSYGVQCPPSIYLDENETVTGREVEERLGFPVFIKPNRSGSSFGVSRVDDTSGVAGAIDFARKEDVLVVIEKAILGSEAGCGVYKRDGKVEVIAVTEIVPDNVFFDYKAKYKGESQEITPARFDQKIYEEIGKISREVYEKLHLKGFVRIDFIVENDSDIPYLIEVNTVPGMSPASIVPQQVAYKGLSLTNFFTFVLEAALHSN